MAQNLIKIVDPDVANKLVMLGFSYILEPINNKQNLFVFASTPDLMRLLQSNFSNSTYIVEDKLRF